ncbi:UNVERIFIED_ORG: hypothetical protein J2W74_001302 [Methylorubrum zatmanii]
MPQPSGRSAGISPLTIAVERRLPTGVVVRLGTIRRDAEGYRFIPNVSGRKPSRRSHGSLTECLPRWVGYPDACETRALNPTAEEDA